MKNALNRSVVVMAALCVVFTFCRSLTAQEMAEVVLTTTPAEPMPHTGTAGIASAGFSEKECLYETGMQTIGTAGRYYIRMGRPEKFIRYQWEFHIVQGDDLNFFALPEGRIAVFSGLANALNRKGQMAYLVGHALGHVLSGHQPENKKQKKPPHSPFSERAWAGMENVAQMAAGFAPAYSGAEEREADRIALILMQLGGYDLYECVHFWENIKNRAEKQHGWPLDNKVLDVRVNGLKKMIPEVLAQHQPLPKEDDWRSACEDLSNAGKASPAELPISGVPQRGTHIFLLVEVLPSAGLQKEKIAALQQIGIVYLEETVIDGFNYTRILLGDCGDTAEAKQKQVAVLEKGFTKALLVEYVNGKRSRILY